MGNGNINVGSKTPTRKPSEPQIDLQNPLQIPLKAERPKNCGAMAEQRGDSSRGNESAPQKFVQLVGCRDPNSRPEPWVRPRPAPVKR